MPWNQSSLQAKRRRVNSIHRAAVQEQTNNISIEQQTSNRTTNTEERKRHIQRQQQNKSQSCLDKTGWKMKARSCKLAPPPPPVFRLCVCPGRYIYTKVAAPKMRKEKRRSDADYTCQRFLQVVLYPYPTTAHSAQFDLLCHQPEPFPRTLTTRMPHLPT